MFRYKLAIRDGIEMKGKSILIPAELQPEALK